MFKKSLIPIIIATYMSISSVAQIPDAILISLKNGNSIELANHFNTELELIVLDKENIYSKTQAQVILKDFFKKHQVENFEIKHQGDKENMHYVIGNLITSSDTFRLSFILKSINNNLLIHQLRIENE